MNVFQAVQKNFGILGICRNQSRFNGRSLMVCLTSGLGTIVSALFLIYDANSFQQYTDNLYITSALAVGFFCISNLILKVNDLFALIDEIETTLDQSKYFAQ